MKKRELNLDIAGGISEVERLMGQFLLKKILYRTIFRGKGLEFDGYRDFNPDDDAGNIDWKASYRANELLVKQYIEERDLKILFIVDVGENMLSGSQEKLKCEYAAELAAALSHLIINEGDNIGFVFFNDKIIQYVPPKKGIKQFNLFVGELSDPLLYGGAEDSTKVLGELSETADSSLNAIIIISDFIRIKKGFSEALKSFSQRFEVMAIMVKDPLDKTLPKIKGELIIEDPVTKEQMLIDPSVAGKKYEKIALEQENMVKQIFIDTNVDFLSLTTDKPFPFYLAEFLRERVRKGKHLTPTR